MSSIELAHEQAGSAFATPTLRMLNHPRAQLVAAVLATVLPAGQPERTIGMSQLAAMANGSLSRLSHAVKRLELQGWIRRASCPGNGRLTRATLTEAGWAKTVASAPGHVQTVRRLVMDSLDATQRHQLRDIGRTILQSAASVEDLDATGAAQPAT